jgi:hypothetical protein
MLEGFNQEIKRRTLVGSHLSGGELFAIGEGDRGRNPSRME